MADAKDGGITKAHLDSLQQTFPMDVGPRDYEDTRMRAFPAPPPVASASTAQSDAQPPVLVGPTPVSNKDLVTTPSVDQAKVDVTTNPSKIPSKPTEVVSTATTEEPVKETPY